ncbi:MAG: NAD(P)H-dependent oxidoreductase [Verrucomicrobiota bacterium]
MKKILAFGASTSSTSINRSLANHAASLIPEISLTQLSLRDFNLPNYSKDEEDANGSPADAQRFLDMIRDHDGVVVSLAEHNGSYAAAFKNLYDWTSRIEQNVWSDKPMLLLSTSPGGRGGATVMEAAKATFPRMGADLAASFSLPSFYDNFSDEGVSDHELSKSLQEAVSAFAAKLS